MIANNNASLSIKKTIYLQDKNYAFAKYIPNSITAAVCYSYTFEDAFLNSLVKIRRRTANGIFSQFSFK